MAMNPQGQIESNYDETVDNFDSMDLKPELLRGEFPVRCQDIIFVLTFSSQVSMLTGERNLHDLLNKAIVLTIM